MRTVLKILAAVAALAIVASAALLAYARYEVRKNGERIRQEYERELARILPAFLEDQKLAEALPVFGPTGSTHDAGPFLNPRIGWDGDRERIATWRAAIASTPLLSLDTALVERIPKEWWTADRSLWSGLDFSWMASLRAYDHWDVEHNSPWAEMAPHEWPNGFPLLHEVTPWCRLRLAKGLAEGRLAEAVTDVEHLARLLLSTETLLGSAMALQQLVSVDRVLRALEERKQPVLRSANRTDAAASKRLWRATMAAPAFFRIETPGSYEEVAQKIRIGRCAALNEALHTAVVLKPLVADRNPGGVRRLEALLNAETTCRLSRVRRDWASPPPEERTWFANSCGRGQDFPLSAACRALSALPLPAMERELAGEVLSQIALGNFGTNGYSERASEPCKPDPGPAR